MSACFMSAMTSFFVGCRPAAQASVLGPLALDAALLSLMLMGVEAVEVTVPST